MTSAIDPTKPTNANPKFLHMRANFAAAKTEIEALQSANAELQATVLVIQSTASIPLMAGGFNEDIIYGVGDNKVPNFMTTTDGDLVYVGI